MRASLTAIAAFGELRSAIVGMFQGDSNLMSIVIRQGADDAIRIEGGSSEFQKTPTIKVAVVPVDRIFETQMGNKDPAGTA